MSLTFKKCKSIASFRSHNFYLPEKVMISTGLDELWHKSGFLN